MKEINITKATIEDFIDNVKFISGSKLDKILAQSKQDQVLFDCVDSLCQGDEALILNRILYTIYTIKTKLYGLNTFEDSYCINRIQSAIEQYLLSYLDNFIPSDVNYPQEPGKYIAWMKDYIDSHAACHHVVYEKFIPEEATLEDLKFFFIQESTIDVSTDDFLALLQTGATGGIKQEISHNYWDEVGEGELDSFHSLLFFRALKSLNVHENELDIKNLDLNALVCGNIQIMFSLKRIYFDYGVGYFGAVEHVAPTRFKSVMRAWERHKLDVAGAQYYILHIGLDVEHSQGWMDNVIAPRMLQNSESIKNMTKGVLYRLESSRMYLDSIRDKFPSVRNLAASWS